MPVPMQRVCKSDSLSQWGLSCQWTLTAVYWCQGSLSFFENSPEQSILFMSPSSLTMLIIDSRSHTYDSEHPCLCLSSGFAYLTPWPLCSKPLWAPGVPSSLRDPRINAGAGGSLLWNRDQGEELSKLSAVLIKGLEQRDHRDDLVEPVSFSYSLR